jgi:hypothetical protein
LTRRAGRTHGRVNGPADGEERGIYAGGPFGMLLTASWFAFPLCRIIYKRIRTRPRE